MIMGLSAKGGTNLKGLKIKDLSLKCSVFIFFSKVEQGIILLCIERSFKNEQNVILKLAPDKSQVIS